MDTLYKQDARYIEILRQMRSMYPNDEYKAQNGAMEQWYYEKYHELPVPCYVISSVEMVGNHLIYVHFGQDD